MTAPRLAWSLCAAALILVLTGPVLLVVTKPDALIYSLTFGGIQIFSSLVGAIVASRLRENAVGRILLAIGTALGLGNTASAYGTLGTTTSHGALPVDNIAAWVGSWTFVPIVFGGVTALLYATAALEPPAGMHPVQAATWTRQGRHFFSIFRPRNSETTRACGVLSEPGTI